MTQLGATFANLRILRENAIHGADRAVVDVLIKQRRIDFRRRLVDKTWRAQHLQNRLLLRDSKRPCRTRARPRSHRRRGQNGAPTLHGGA